MTRWIYLGRVVLVATLVCGPGSVSSLSQSASENQIKAAFMFNFAKFIEWPTTAFVSADSPLNFCTLGHDAVVEALEATVHGKIVGRRRTVVRMIRGPEEVNGCHLIFQATSSVRQQAKLIQTTQALPILLVSDSPGFAQAGGTINFLSEDGRVRFEVNPRAAARSHLIISSQLLALARLVPDEGKLGTP